MLIANLKIKEFITGRFKLTIRIPFGEGTCAITTDQPYSTIKAARYQALQLAKHFHLTFQE